jgi:hypothetical protein
VRRAKNETIFRKANESIRGVVAGAPSALPLVPFICDVFVGDPLFWRGDRRGFMDSLDAAVRGLAAEGHFPPWE